MAKEYNIKKFPSRESWLKERVKGIGASEAGAILGLSKYTTPYKLWRLKIGLDEPVQENWSMKQGHYYEQMVADDFEQELGFAIIKNSAVDFLAIDKKRPYLRVSPDRMFWLEGMKHNMENRGLLECKSSRLDLEPSCLSDVHLDWYCQLQYQLYVMRLKYGYLGYVNVETGKHWFEYVEYNAEFCENTLIPAIDNFWNNNVVPAQLAVTNIKETDVVDDFAPDDICADDTILRYPKQEEGTTIEASAEIIEQYQEYCQRKAQIKELETAQESFEENVKMILGSNEAMTIQGKAIVTWKANKPSKTFDSKKFKEENSDIYNNYLVDKAGSRIFRVK